MKNISLLSIVLVSWFAYACSTSEGKNKSIEDPDQIPVEIISLSKEEIPNLIQASGQFTTNDETYMSFKSGGVIEKIYVKEGDAVHKGQLLATLNLTEINAGLAQVKLALEKATRDFNRVSNLYKDSVVTLEQYQNAKTGLDVATQQYEAVKFNRSFSEIHALDNGYVLKKLANEGQVITSGTPVLQTNGAKQDNWILKVGLSDREWATITTGDKATIITDALPNQKLTAEVYRKSEGTDPYTGTFTVELKLTGKTPKSIASGLFGKAVILASKKQSAWSIPYEALLDGDSESGYVFTTSDMKTAQKKQVTISSIENDKVIIASGLEGVQALIVSGSAYLRDNSSIRILQPAAKK